MFMVAGSKSLISFTELEKSFYSKYKDLKDNTEYIQNKRTTIYKFISYQLILKNIDLTESFEKAGGRLPVATFRQFLKDDLELE